MDCLASTHHIDRIILKWQFGRRALNQLDVREFLLIDLGLTLSQHSFIQIKSSCTLVILSNRQKVISSSTSYIHIN